MGDERNLPVRYGLLFKPGVQALERSTLSHIQYWVVKSGSIIRKWRAQEKENDKGHKGKGKIRSYFEQDNKRKGLRLRRRGILGRRRRRGKGAVRSWERMRKERRRVVYNSRRRKRVGRSRKGLTWGSWWLMTEALLV